MLLKVFLVGPTYSRNRKSASTNHAGIIWVWVEGPDDVIMHHSKYFYANNAHID